tara:strand:- start:129 stop:575 length:447 start_codon:yes stop_codon:yes gene_type:complete
MPAYPIWDSWGASIRDLYILNTAGDIISQQNVTSGIPTDLDEQIISLLSTDTEVIPNKFIVKQNFPNPFNPMTTISFEIPLESIVSLTIYDIQGKVVRKLVHRSKLVGSHNMVWDATNDKGLAVSAGMYFYSLEFDDIAKTMKMLLIK